MSIVIVGNGRSLLGSKLGNLIDSHDIVVRVNNFRIHGYEEDVGVKRTQHWRAYKIVNSDFPTLSDDGYGEFDEAILWPIARQASVFNPELKLYKKWTEADKEILKLTRDACFPMKKNPTSGMMAIVYAMQKFDTISICGFDCICNPSLNEYGYYFNPPIKDNTFDQHDFLCEHSGMKSFGKRIIIIQ